MVYLYVSALVNIDFGATIDNKSKPIIIIDFYIHGLKTLFENCRISII